LEKLFRQIALFESALGGRVSDLTLNNFPIYLKRSF